MITVTLAQMKVVEKEAMVRLVKDAGSIPHLAKMLNVHVMSVHGWVTRGRISKGGARLVAAHPAFCNSYTATDLRPDIEYVSPVAQRAQ